MMSSSSGLGRRGFADVVADGEVEAGCRDDVVDAHAGVIRAQPHGAVRRLEIKHAEVGHDASDVVETQGALPGRRGAAVPDPADNIDVLDKGTGAVVRAPSSWWGG